VHINFSKTRHFFVFITVISLFLALFTRLLYVQIIRHAFLSELADRQHKIFVKLEPRRGNIYDRLGRVLAIYLDAASFYAVPKEINDKRGTANILAKNLNLNKEELLRRFNKNNNFAWIKRKLDSKLAKKVKGLNVKGVYSINEDKRFYPGGKLACHALGITGIDNTGLEGIELYYDKELNGEYGWRYTERDAKQREIVSFEKGVLPARDGDSLVLTIDEVIQHIIEKEIENIVTSYRPGSVSIVALEPATGEILGIANYPQFDPNDTSKLNRDFVRNRAIADAFEPGSIFKIVTASAALEEGTVDFDSEFFCENGAYRIGSRTLRDHKPHGNLTFREVIEESSNIGTAKVADKLGKERLYAYIKRFNFGKPTGIDLPGEASGIMREARTWSYVDMTTIPMGQGIAVTALQMASAVSTIANKGILMRPYILKEVLDEEGVPIRENRPRIVRRVISKKTSDKAKELLKGVIEEGTGKPARLDNFIACGKTGTAQKVKPEGGYYEKKYISSFIGFAPYDNPAVSLVISVDEPRGKHFGSQVAAPAFKNIMEKIFSYMEIEGDRDEIKKTS
jgi:cell division protein FtsI/penicillin-binding protein 2